MKENKNHGVPMREHINFFLVMREHVHWGMQVWSTKNIEYVFFLCMLVSKPYIFIVFICVMQAKNGGGEGVKAK